MKGCARTCLLQLLGWGVASGAFYFYLSSLGDLGTPLIWASLGAGLCVALALGWALGIKSAAGERATLLAAMEGSPPDDGAWIAVSGRIHSMHALRGPLSGDDVVAYEYKVSRMERSGKSSSLVTYYEGKALVPSTIATRHGSIRLLSVPTFDVAPLPFSRYQDALANLRQYIAETSFQTTETPKEQRIGMTEEQTDDDGSFRVDKRHFPDRDLDLELDGFQLEEKAIRQNETVCAFGLYSQQRGGLIPHPNWARQTRVMRGDAGDVARQLRARILKYAIGVVVFGAAAWGIVRLYAANT